MNLTRQEILSEFAKSIQNPIYAIEKYLETFDKTQESFVPFKLFPRQKEIIYAYEEHRFNLVTKPRQAGVSTTTAAYMSIKVGFASKKNPEAILIVANKQDLAFEFLAKIKDFLSQLPRWVWGPEFYGSKKNLERTIFVVDSKKEIRLPNGSRVKAVATNKDALRGFTPTYLVMDEAAYIDHGAEVFGAALTALGTGGHATLISTPNGMDPLYFNTYDLATKGENNFNIIEMKWYEDRRYNKGMTWLKGDEDPIPEVEFTFESYQRMLDAGYKPTAYWYEQMCLGLNNDAKMIAQELDVSFVGSGGNVIADEWIKYQNVHNVRPPIAKFGADEAIWVWSLPIEGHKYVLGSDVARGDGEDSSTIVIIDTTTMEQVMEYQGKIQPDLLAQLIEEWGTKYSAYAVVDVTGGMGVATVLKLLEFEYKFLHYDNVNGKVLSSRQKVLNNKDKIAGFHATSVRLPMISNLEYQVRTNGIKIRSVRATSEMQTFVYKNGRPDHMEGKHDDILMAIAMPLWTIEHSFKNLVKAEKQSKAILNSWMSTQSLTQKVEEEVPNKRLVSSKPKPISVPMRGTNENTNKTRNNNQYLWLFSK